MGSRIANIAVLLLGLTRAIYGQNGIPILPVITGCTQSLGAGSTLSLTVFGSGFQLNSTVGWNGLPLAATMVGATQVTALVPAGLWGVTDSATISVNSSGITSNCLSTNLSTSVLTPPIIVSASPNQVGAGGASFTVTVSGSGFLAGSVVEWAGIPIAPPTSAGSTPLATTFRSAGQLSALVPASLIASSGAYSLNVVNPDGTVSNSLRMIAQPVLTTISPNSATVGASGVTITATGTGFVSTDLLVISLSSTQTSIRPGRIGATTMIATVPAALLTAAGQATISVSDPAAGLSSAGLPFTISQPPAITTLSPGSVFVGGPGFTLVVGGSGFLAGATVQWAGVPLPTKFVGGTLLTAAVTASLISARGSVGITVAVPGGGTSNTMAFTVAWYAPSGSQAVVNAASGLPSIAPGSLISIYGKSLAVETRAAGRLPARTSLNGTSVTINGVLAPLFLVSPTQINAQVPFETPVGNATPVVVAAGQKNAAVTFMVTATGPGVLMQPEGSHAIAQNYPDWSLNSPENPARPGQYITVYLTGQGLLDNPVATGAVAPVEPLSRAVAPAQAKIGGIAAEIQFLGLAPGLVGVSQMNLLIPEDVAAGEQPLEVSIGGVAANTSTLSVQAQ
jgi:uncharacterized protein (TIGR03437 family)